MTHKNNFKIIFVKEIIQGEGVTKKKKRRKKEYLFISEIFFLF